MFFLNVQRVNPETTIDPADEAIITVASLAKNG